MKIELVAVKQRAEKGTYASGATTFKIEGLIQAAVEGQLVFISPQLISRRFKNYDSELPSSLNKYQTGAFETALVALRDHG